MSSSTASRAHESQPAPSSEPAATSPKRLSRLNDFMSRSRTSSLPQRPQSTSGVLSSVSRQKFGQKLGSKKDKGKDRVEGEESISSKAASSSVSVLDPFSAHATSSSSFVTFSPTSASFAHSGMPAPLNARSYAADTDSTESVRSQPNSPISPTQPTPPLSMPARRRGSILVAASDALSSFARKTPMRSLHLNMGGLGRQNSAKGFTNASQPIVLTEVIEISESAIRASKLREEEEAERERLREAAARALGINDKDVETASMASRKRAGALLDLYEDENEEDDEGGMSATVNQRAWVDDEQTPTSTSLPSLPSPFGHSRSRSGSYIPPHTLHSLPARSPTPLSSLSSQNVTPPQYSGIVTRPQTPKSFSTPPSSTVPTLRVNTFSPSKSHIAHESPLGSAVEIPPFPSTPAALSPFTRLSGAMPRYYPAPSLLMFTLTKQWKNRYLVFTSPLVSPSTHKPVIRSPWGSGTDSGTQLERSTTPVPSFLHLFKTSGGEEKELERLEINEESVVYVAEGEVGGRKGVIKVGGLMRKKRSPPSRPAPAGTSSRTSSSSIESAGDANEPPLPINFDTSSSSSANADGRTMWIVQITDTEEAQKWIGAIKGSVLNQRSIRAGLGMPNGMEPRGDLDVMLSMHAQSLFSTPSAGHTERHSGGALRSHGGASPTKATFGVESSHASAQSHLSRSQSTTASTGYSSTTASMTSGDTGSTITTTYSAGSNSPIPRATTALKSLFTIATSNRPRSPSTSSLTPPSSAVHDDDMHPEDSFGHAGTNLMSMARSNSYVSEHPMSPSTPIIPNTPRAGTPIIPPEAFLERKILPDPVRQLMESEVASEPIMTKKATTNTTIGFGRPQEVSDRHALPSRISSDGVTSIALQPPPMRKRAGTFEAVTVSVSSAAEHPAPSYTYSHANSSTAESLGVSMGVQNSSLLTPPMPVTPTSSAPTTTPRPKDRRIARASWSSVSTYGSGDHPPSSPDDSRSRRWSRRSSVPHRMSPPYPGVSSPPSSPLMRDIQPPSIRHPYASESTLSRSSSVGSGHSRVSELQVRPFSSKRASTASVQSCSTSSTHSHPAMVGNKSAMSTIRQKAAHRASLPPPQRPAPISALPPTPTENGFASPSTDTPQSPHASKTLRESLILRGNRRLSSTPPTLPPTSALPPRPDEPVSRSSMHSHRRSSSQGTPSSPSGSKHTSLIYGQAPMPPPNSPLPLPPRPHTAATSSPPARSSSLLRRRLRMLSSPPTSPPSTIPPWTPVDEFVDTFSSPVSIPESPIIPGPITMLRTDPSFLSISPITAQEDSSPLDIAPHGLSPPPRRGSRQVATPDREKLQQDIEPFKSAVFGTGKQDVEASHSPVPGPPPEVDDFAPLLAPKVRSSEQSAVSLVDIRI